MFYTVDQLINIGSTKELTFYKTSIHDSIDHIEYVEKNIYDDYIEELLEVSVLISLTDKEYHKYRYKPKVLAHDLYKSTDLYYLLLLVNDIVSEKDFDFKTLRVIPPANINIINDILNSERNYLLYNGLDYVDDNYDDNYIGDNSSFPDVGSEFDDEIYDNIQDIINEIENIKRIIKDMLEELLTEDIKDLMKEIVDRELSGLIDIISELVDEKLDERIKHLLDEIQRVRVEINDRIDVEVGYIYEELHNIKKVVNNILFTTENNKSTINDIMNRIESIETTISNLDAIIETIISQKLDERVNNIIERIEILENNASIPDNIAEMIDQMNKDILQLKDDIDSIMSNNNKEIIDQLRKDFEEFKSQIESIINPDIQKILDDLSDRVQLISDMTRDVVFVIPSPIALGVQPETEFFIPYKGSIKQCILSAGVDSNKTSNIIIILQLYDEESSKWVDVEEYILHASDYNYKIDTSINIDNTNVRFNITGGDLSYITHLSFILKVLEDFPEEPNPEEVPEEPNPEESV